jgi:hypothetical protein
MLISFVGHKSRTGIVRGCNDLEGILPSQTSIRIVDENESRKAL